jgi:drug/metabolite transporter (DMT)-like permease
MFLTRNNDCYGIAGGPPAPITRGSDMAAKTPGYQRLIVGVGGALLIASVFLPWADVEGVNQTGWEFNTVAAVYFLIGGVFGIATAITGGQYGVCRPDVSLIGATDLLNTISMLLLAWLIFDFPEHATRQPGVFVALISAAITAFAVADYRPLQGAPWFPPIKTSKPTRASIQQ